MTLQSSTLAAADAATIRVFLAEDHAITMWGMQRLIESTSPRMRVIGTANSHAQLMNHDAAAQADVILLDLDLGGEDAGASLASLRVRCPGRVLVVTGSDDPAAHRAAVMRGARGVVHKSESAETILRAIEKVHGGEVWLHRALVGEVLGLFVDTPSGADPARSDPDAKRIATLTPREREIVVTMTRSASLKQLSVASELGMSEHTLRNHLTTIYSKLHVRGRLELHVYATQHGIGAATRLPGEAANQRARQVA